MDKQQIREKIWKTLEDNNVASFPRPVFGRIPNFKGSSVAGERLSRLDLFKKAKLVKVNPDSPQTKVRELVLSQGKKLLVPTPRLNGEFFLLDGKEVDPRKASSIKGITSLGERVPIESIDKVDLVVVGSVAVTIKGDRVGKGEGYSELEYAIMRELGKVDERTPIVTTVHEMQIVDSIPREPFDLSLDWVITQERVIKIDPEGRKPSGLILNLLPREKVEKTPFLKEYLKRYHPNYFYGKFSS
jgi:5-formyltetrahydrofolate cyclo-ligase